MVQWSPNKRFSNQQLGKVKNLLQPMKCICRIFQTTKSHLYYLLLTHPAAPSSTHPPLPSSITTKCMYTYKQAIQHSSHCSKITGILTQKISWPRGAISGDHRAPQGNYMDNTWAPIWNFVDFSTWVFLGSHLDVNWVLLGFYLGVTWVFPGSHWGVT